MSERPSEQASGSVGEADSETHRVCAQKCLPPFGDEVVGR